MSKHIECLKCDTNSNCKLQGTLVTLELLKKWCMLHLKSVLEEKACRQCVTFSMRLLLAIAVLGIPMSKDHN